MTKTISIILILLVVVLSARADTGLQVRLKTKTAKFAATQDVIVTVELTNTGDNTILINKAALPNEDLPDRLFNVILNGASVKYVGPIIKRAPPSAAQTVALGSGKSISGSMSLPSAYDLTKSGNYQVQYDVSSSEVIFKSATKSKGSDSVVDSQVQSNTLTLDVAGRSQKQRGKVTAAGAKTTKPSFLYTSCSKSQISLLTSATSVAQAYTQGAYNYLVVTKSRTLKRYPTWFGTYAVARWNKVRSNYLKILNAFKTVTIQYDCACRDIGIYAYVYVDTPYVIYLCGYFWETTLTGTDSKGGTLIHEMSHFTIVSGTYDHVYGQTGAKALALSDPDKAIQNADTHEYFAENTPWQS